MSLDKRPFSIKREYLRRMTDNAIEEELREKHPNAIPTLRALKDIAKGQSVVYHTGIHLGTLPQAIFLAEIASRLVAKKLATTVQKRGETDTEGHTMFQYIAIGK
jgi:hypothetical protein